MTILAPKVKTDIAEELLTDPVEERQVTVIYQEIVDAYYVYVDPDIRLIDEASGAEARLVSVLGIEVFPNYIFVEDLKTDPCLVFEPLPKGCRSFMLYEPARDNLRPFRVPNIQRNDQDVYRISVG